MRNLLVALIIFFSLLQVGCGKKLTEKATYIIAVKGTVEEAGVIEFAGYEMNVYKDLAANSCGTCDDQPVSIYVGAEEQDVLEAIEKLIERTDDIWIIKGKDSNSIVLEEKTIGEAEKPKNISAPKGLTLKGEYKGAM